MSRHRLWTLACITLAACTSSPAADPTSPNDPPSNTKPAAPANIAGEWIDTNFARGWVDIWHVTQQDTIVTITDSLWTEREDTTLGIWDAGACSSASPCTYGGIVRGDTVALVNAQAITHLTSGVASSGRLLMTDALGDSDAYVRGTWTPPTPPSVIALNGVYMSDSLPWTALGEPCLGTIQIDLVIDKAGPGYPNAPAGGYMSTEYDRQCGSNWQDAIASWVVIDSGRVSNGVLSLAENELPTGYTGPFTTAGNNWQFQVVSNDSLADITPSSINLGWRPPAFVYQPAGFYASVNAVALSRRASGRRSRP